MRFVINILVLLSLLAVEPVWAQTEEAVSAVVQTEAEAQTDAVEQAIEASEQGEELDVKQVVLSHIADSYEWHICSVGERHISVPLPVIVRSQSGEWHCFSSSKLHHGHQYEGFHIAEEGAYAGRSLSRRLMVSKFARSISRSQRPLRDCL